jgi:hypothetical protein
MKTKQISSIAFLLIAASIPKFAYADEAVHKGAAPISFEDSDDIPFRKVDAHFGLSMDPKDLSVGGMSIGADVRLKDHPILALPMEGCDSNDKKCGQIQAFVLHPELRWDAIQRVKMDLSATLGSAGVATIGGSPSEHRSGLRIEIMKAGVTHEEHVLGDALTNAVQLTHELQGRLVVGAFDVCGGAAFDLLMGKIKQGEDSTTMASQERAHVCAGFTGENGRIGYDFSYRNRGDKGDAYTTAAVHTVSWRPFKSNASLDFVHETEKVTGTSGAANSQSLNSVYGGVQF